MTTVIDKPSLLDRLQSASEGSRELDFEIYAAKENCKVFSTAHNWLWQMKAADGRVRIVNAVDIPDYTTSLDAKLPGEDIVHVYERSDGRWAAIQRHGEEWADANTEVLARRCAILKAKEAEEKMS